jgi:hypothetical protein
MRVLVAFILVCLTADVTSAFAQGTDALVQSQDKPSPESIRNLLELMQSKKILQAMTEQLDSTYDGMLNKQLEGQDLTPEQQKDIAVRRKAAMDMVRELLNWKSMESLYLKVYSDTFTQSEIDGMAAFYASPAGQAVVLKLPLAAKNTMAEMQVRVRQMIPKLQQMAKETAEQIKAQGGAKKSG